jgi:hypothetical protein
MLEHSGTQMVHRDHAAGAALRCARAAADVPATRDGLEHPRGLFAAMGGDAAGLLEHRDRSAIGEVAFRRHPTTGFAQALVDAARELAPVEPAGEVLAQASEAANALAGNPDPSDAEEAWWSCEHAVAVTLLGLDLEDETLVDDARVSELRRRVRLSAGEASRVTVDGRSAERLLAALCTDDDLIAKWRTLNPDDAAPLELLA